MREILPEENIHPLVRDKISDNHRDTVSAVQAAVSANDIVVIGMKQNPHCKKARALLKKQGLAFEYLQYGSYWLGQWRRRNAIKMWTGWPTLPIIFVKGVLIGGTSDLGALIDSGDLDGLLS
jgi:monothiol glutaredoxin